MVSANVNDEDDVNPFMHEGLPDPFYDTTNQPTLLRVHSTKHEWSDLIANYRTI